MDTTGCGQQAGDTHPTGMHTCLNRNIQTRTLIWIEIWLVIDENGKLD